MTDQPANTECGCSRPADARNVLFYACSGGANVAEVADRACRDLMYEGEGTMFCLAGLGADIQGMIQTARDADLNVVLDGCDMDCAKRIFDAKGVRNYIQIKITDLDIGKEKGVAATDEQVQRVKVHVRRKLKEAS